MAFATPCSLKNTAKNGFSHFSYYSHRREKFISYLTTAGIAISTGRSVNLIFLPEWQNLCRTGSSEPAVPKYFRVSYSTVIQYNLYLILGFIYEQKEI